MPYDRSKLAKLKELLDTQEQFPHDFPLKFIGHNSQEFKDGVKALEKSYPELRLQHARESSGGNHLAMTYLLLAQTSDEIVLVLEAVSRIKDVLVIL